MGIFQFEMFRNIVMDRGSMVCGSRASTLLYHEESFGRGKIPSLTHGKILFLNENLQQTFIKM